MNPNFHTADWDAKTTADLQDIAAFDRLAAQQAPATALHRYAHERRTTVAGPRRNSGWQRLWAAVRRFYDEQKHLQELYQSRLDVSGSDAIAATQALQRPGTEPSTDAAPMDVAAAQQADRKAA